MYVRLYNGTTQHETDDEVLELPPPPLKWKDVITTMVAAIGKEGEYEDGLTTPKARLFLLPTEITGIAAELNARSLRFGVRENDHFVICLQGEDYQQPSERYSDPATTMIAAPSSGSSGRPTMLSTPNANSVTTQPSISPYANGPSVGSSPFFEAMKGLPIGVMSGDVPSGVLMSSGKKGNKRYRSISGKMAAIKSLSDKGLISNDDRGHLKDLLLNNDSPQLQEALEKYNNTGDFQAVKKLLLKESFTPSAKRNTGDWLSESFVNEIAFNLNTTSPVAKIEPIPVQTVSNVGHFSTGGPLTQSVDAYGYDSSQSAPINASNYSQSTPMTTNHYLNTTSLAPSSCGNLPSSSGYTSGLRVPNGYQSSPIVAQYQQPQASPTNVYAGVQPQINLPLRDRATYMKCGYGSSPVQNVMSMNPPVISPATSSHLAMNGYGARQGYTVNQMSFPANVIYARDQSQYPMNTYMSGPINTGDYNPYHQQPQYAMNRFGYGSMQADMGYNFYAAGYGFGKAQLRAGPGGKWTTAPPMPSYPPPCSKEEKKEKIAKWLKKRENRNWSNKPSYPVRHSIAKNRKRGEDGRFITKARLAEMAAEEAAAAVGLCDEPLKASSPSPSSEESAIFLVAQTTIPQATSVP